MNIVIISGSNRKNSQSIKVSEICKKVLNKLSASASVIDLHKKPIPLWDELETHINTFFENKSLKDLLNNNKETRV